MIILVNLLFILLNCEEIDTLGYKMTRDNKKFSNSEGKYFSIRESCQMFEILNPVLNSKVDISKYYFLVNLTCNDIVDDEEFFNKEKEQNTTVDKDSKITNKSPYQCTLNVTFDNSEHCCCPERKNGFKLKILN